MPIRKDLTLGFVMELPVQIENFQLSPEIVGLIGAVIAAIVIYRMGVAVGRGKTASKNKGTSSKGERTQDQHIRSLNAKVSQLNALNARYLSFMLNVPIAVKRLNATFDFDEIISSVTRLVRDITNTDTVDIYVFDEEEKVLKKSFNKSAFSPNQPVSFALGQGLVGKAGQDRIVKTAGYSDNDLPEVDIDAKAYSQKEPWIAAPITFNNRLLGVIAISKPGLTIGNEANLLVMIADIAATALNNQAYMGGAKQEASTDPLTGLYNRRYFFDKAEKAVEEAILDSTPVSIFLFDIDNFKVFNDTNGHPEGDVLLKELATLVRKSTRKNSVFARYGGEEFIVLLPGITKEGAHSYADRVRQTIAKHPFAHREKQPLGMLSISGGVASFPLDGSSLQETIRLADEALYKAKEAGRNRVAKHEPHLFS